MQEIWRDIIGYEGLYQVSNFGNVKSLGNGICKTKEKIMKARKNKWGYLYLNLSKGGKKKTYTIHRLVAHAFLPNPYNLPQVNHKDEDKTNNRVDNLEFCSAKSNCNYGTRNIRSAEKRYKKVLCVEKCKIYPSLKEAAKQTGISISSLSMACTGKYKTVFGFQWRYVN